MQRRLTRCCGVTLRTGVFLICACELILCILYISFYTWVKQLNERDVYEDESAIVLHIHEVLVFRYISLIMDIILLVGAVLKKRILILIWIIGHCILLVPILITSIIVFILYCVLGEVLWITMFLIECIVSYGLISYWLLVTYSYILELDEESSRAN